MFRLERPRDFRISLGLALAALVVGTVGVLQVIGFGQHGALTNYVPWGLWVGIYVYLVWLEVGMILSYFVLRRVLGVEAIAKLGPIVILAALSALIGALVIIGMDLGHPFRFWKAYVFPNFGSLMTWMIWLHSAYLLLLVGELFAYREGKPELLRWLTYISIPAGVVLISVIGGLFGVIAARPFWNASVLPLMFFISSLVAGLGLLTLLHLLFSPTAGTPAYAETAVRLGRFFAAGIVVGMIAAAANLLVISYPNVPAHAEGLRLMLFGPFAWTFWGVHVFGGLIVPLVLLVFFPRNLRAIGVAAALMVVTFVMVPVNIVIPGLAYPTPDLAGLKEAFRHPRLTFDYVPDLTEWLVVAFAAGLALAIFTLGYRFVIEPYLRRTYRTPAAGSAPPAA